MPCSAGSASYLVVHVTDLYKLGLMYPDKIGVAYKNFPLTGNMHGMINHMKVQLRRLLMIAGYRC